MSQEQAFDYLTTEGVLEPIGPTPDPVPHMRTKWWNPNKYFRYHQGNGHSTEKCFKLKDRIQDLVDNGSFHISSGDKKPNIQTSPLSVLLIDDEECSFDPTSYITPVGQPMPPIITPPDDNQINGIWDDKETSAQDGSMIRILSKIVEAFESFNLRMTILEQTVQDNLDDNRKMVQWITDQYKRHESSESDNKINLPNGVPSLLQICCDVKKARRQRREYTPLWMTYTQALDRLKSKGALSPIGPTADPPAERKSPRWDPNKY
ncbi:RNA-directed RNA polymerase L [Bienertia sinuspersici]